MQIRISIIDKNGFESYYEANGSLEQLVLDGLIDAHFQDENWHDEDTCNLIVRKLKGQSPIEHVKIN